MKSDLLWRYVIGLKNDDYGKMMFVGMVIGFYVISGVVYLLCR